VDTLSLGIWPEEGVLMGRPSKFSPEFREQAVELVRATGKTIAEVARDLQINDTTLGNWVKADRAERGEPDSSGLLPLTAAERAELTRLRRENAKLKTEREILKKAAAFFVTSRRGDAVRLHRPGEGPPRRRRAVPAAEGQPVGLLRLAVPPALAACARR
jgi:transposase